MTVGIDGGYVRNWHEKNTNFEVIAGKSFSTTQPSKQFGFVQKIDDKPQRRLMNILAEQGMQANQQITFFRYLQYFMYPESEHILDWFHVTMKLTVLNLDIYIRNNQHLIPNYGEKWRYGEAISTSFVESTINEVVAKRMVKKQQMQWKHQGAHYMLQTRTAVLNNDLHRHFERWYPGLKIEKNAEGPVSILKMAA